MTDPHWLFSYGTLQDPAVQQGLFGREVEAAADFLDGFEVGTVTITDPAVIAASGSDRHPALRRSDAAKPISGQALALTSAELAIADRYEAENYARIPVTLASGRAAYVYVHKSEADALPDEVRISRPDEALLQRLLPVAGQIFRDTFGRDFAPDALKAFCDEVYRPGGLMSRDFASPDVRWRVATSGGNPVGYAKLTPLRAPVPDALPAAMELQQIYLLAEWHGRGVADRLMEWAIGEAQHAGAPELYLTVFDHNHRAKRFYARHGFAECGRCSFELGGRAYDDRVWRRSFLKKIQ